MGAVAPKTPQHTVRDSEQLGRNVVPCGGRSRLEPWSGRLIMGPTGSALRLVASIEAVVLRLPVVGEQLLRGLQRTAADLAFGLPLLGG